MPNFPMLDGESVFAFDRASPIPMSLPEKVTRFVREVRRQRALAAAQGMALVAAPTKEQLVALALWADKKEREALANGVAGLGEGEGEGAAQGAAAGASVGIVAGPWGAVIGAVVGGIAGAVTGRAAAKKQATSAKKAASAAKTGLKAAQVGAKGQTESAGLILEAEKVKAEAAGKIPTWGWAVIVIGGVALLSGTVFYVMKD